jgi:hypothetical protein
MWLFEARAGSQAAALETEIWLGGEDDVKIRTELTPPLGEGREP